MVELKVETIVLWPYVLVRLRKWAVEGVYIIVYVENISMMSNKRTDNMKSKNTSITQTWELIFPPITTFSGLITRSYEITNSTFRQKRKIFLTLVYQYVMKSILSFTNRLLLNKYNGGFHSLRNVEMRKMFGRRNILQFDVYPMTVIWYHDEWIQRVYCNSPYVIIRIHGHTLWIGYFSRDLIKWQRPKKTRKIWK